MTQQNYLARERALKKRRRERLLAAVHERVQRYRERRPLPQAQLELGDEYYSRRQHEQRVLADYIEAVLP